MDIKVAIVEQPGDNINIQTAKLDEPKANEVHVKMVATGVCHTDLGVKDQHIKTPLPIALGHEGAGVVEKVGPGVIDFVPGDHVVLSFSYCNSCRNCLEGHPAACETFADLNFGGAHLEGTTRINDLTGNEVATLFGQSSLATYAIAHTNNLVKVDPTVDLRLLGPLACGIQTGAGTVINKLQPKFGESIVIFGCGGVGLSGIMAAKLTGAKTIIAVDIIPERLELAKELGATHTINGKEEDVVEKVHEITSKGSDYVLEATGVPALILQGIRSLRVRGTMATVGVGPDMTLNIHDELIPPNRTIMGVVEGDTIPKLFIPELIEYYQAGKLPIDKLIKFYPFENLQDAIDDMLSGKTIKPVITFE